MPRLAQRFDVIPSDYAHTSETLLSYHLLEVFLAVSFALVFVVQPSKKRFLAGLTDKMFNVIVQGGLKKCDESCNHLKIRDCDVFLP